MIINRIELGKHVKLHRDHKGYTQDEVADRCGVSTNRSAVSHLELGLRIPKPSVLKAICDYVDLPLEYWKPFTESSSLQRYEFEECLSDLVGVPLNLDSTNRETVLSAEETISDLFRESLPDNQTFDLFNKALVFYGTTACSKLFFDLYLKAESLVSLERFKHAIEEFQKDAIRLRSSLSEAYRLLNTCDDLEEVLGPLRPRENLKSYTERKEWAGTIENIPDEKLPYLGYISAARVRREANERQILKDFLEGLATALRNEGTHTLERFGERKKRQIDSLLRKFDTNLPHGVFSPLFAPDPDALLREASRLAPKTTEELEEMEQTQLKALKNLAHYLTSDHLDVYVATSMRTDADFVSINTFVRFLFRHSSVKHLKLRYFNPTQSWIDDRVAKGLVEALMLKRCSFAIYMAQESDTFGKDSEASVALGQGKPVIVYVPKLVVSDVAVDTETLGQKSRDELVGMAKKISATDSDFDDTLDNESLMGFILMDQLRSVSDLHIAEAAKRQWADFDLYSEANRIKNESERAEYRRWLDGVRTGVSPTSPIPGRLREQLIGLLVAKGIRFERRAKVFREIHPLALQVILSTGVLNGILVVRSIEQCAKVLGSLVENKLDLRLIKDDNNYRLIDEATGSTVRVISRHELLRNAFEAHTLHGGS